MDSTRSTANKITGTQTPSANTVPRRAPRIRVQAVPASGPPYALPAPEEKAIKETVKEILHEALNIPYDEFKNLLEEKYELFHNKKNIEAQATFINELNSSMASIKDKHTKAVVHKFIHERVL